MEIINFLQDFAQTSGLKATIVLGLTMVLTNLIKIPIKKHSTKIATLAQSSGFNISESFINSMIVYLPFGLTFVLFCIIDGVAALASGGAFDIVQILATTPLIATSSVGLYSIIDAALTKTSQNKEYKEFLKSKTETNDSQSNTKS